MNARSLVLAALALAAVACGEQPGSDEAGSGTGDELDTGLESGSETGPETGQETGTGTGSETEAGTEDTQSDTGEPPIDCFDFTVTDISAAGPQVLWQHLEAAIGRARDLVVGPDGTAYVSVDGDGNGERQLVAIDAEGSVLWARADDADHGHGLALAGDRLIAGGTSIVSPTDHPDWLRVIDLQGALVDEILEDDGDDAFWHVEAGPGGEILVAGRYWVEPLNQRVALYEPDLSLRWVHFEGPVGGNNSSSMPQIAFDGAGRAHASYRFEPPETRRVVRFDALGEVEWIADFVGADLPNNAWPGALAFADGQGDAAVYVGGRASALAWFGAFAADGQPLWSSTYGSQTWDEIQAIIPVVGAAPLGFHVAGEISGGAPGCSQCRDAWVAGLSTGGKVLWTATADGEAGLNDAIYAMAKAPNGDLLVAGRVQCGGLVAGEHPFVARLRPG
ncbi:MAG: hypothetical protein KC431_10405 [Myxococcales bacterium]|nr:hypothetical protein [Myxococcales bacterium]